MAIILTPEQQEEFDRVKQWWADNGKSLIIGLVLGFGSLFGWKAWQHYHTTMAHEAADLFDQQYHQASMNEPDRAAVISQGNKLVNEYSTTPYASAAALQMAKVLADAGKYEQAAKQLSWVRAHNDADSSFGYTATLRLASIYRQLQQPQKGLDLLSPVPAGAIAALYHEQRGDLLTDMKRRDDAYKAYTMASSIWPEKASRYWLDIKRQNVSPAP